MSQWKCPDEVYKQLQQQHGESNVRRIEHEVNEEEIVVVVRKATAPEFRRYMQEITEPSNRAKSTERLARDTLLWPSGDQVSALFDVFPGIPLTIGSAIAELAGATGRAQIKK